MRLRMKKTILLLALLAFPVVSEATMYVYLDANGNRHYMDIPDRREKMKIMVSKLNRHGPRPSAAKAPYTSGQILPKVDKAALDGYIHAAAAEHHVDPELVRAVIKTESNFNPTAVSPKGALGLMQLMPGTARDMQVKEPFNPQENIHGGTKYLGQMLTAFNGDLRLGLAAYNAGPGRVTPDGMTVYIPETQQYVAKVLNNYRLLTGKTVNTTH